MSSPEHNKTNLLSKWLKQIKNKDDDAIGRRLNRDFAPLSDAQKRLWLLQHLYPKNPFYNFVDKNIVKGNLDIERLIDCINHVIQQNESLRTNFVVHKDEIVQQVKDFQEVDVKLKDFTVFNETYSITKANQLIKDESLKPFNLASEALFRVILCKISENHHQLFFVMHHIVVDKWSLKLMRDQIYKDYNSISNSQYSNSNSNSNTIQFGDYTSWLKQKVNDEKQITYWKTKLSGELNTLELPYDYRRPLTPSFKGSVLTKKLHTSTIIKVKKISVLKNTTPFVTLLTAFKILLYKYSAQNDIVVGIPITTRDRKELESIIGFFDETLPLRTKLNGDLSFSNTLEIVKQTASEAFSNKEISFETIVKTVNPERSLSVNPIFQVMFIYNKDETMATENEGLEWTNEVFNYHVSKFDLTLYASESENGMSISFEYAHDLFKASTIEKMLNHFDNILGLSLENPDLKIQDLSILSEDEKNELINIGRNKESPVISNDITQIQQYFENEVINNPDNAAVISNGNTYSYKDVNKKSNALAIHLNNCGVNINDRVGLCVNPSVDTIIGILGILKSGASYVPIAVDAPKERLDYIVKDADTTHIVIDHETHHLFQNRALQLHSLENIKVDDESKHPYFGNSKNSNIAYTLYTSGSTGQPKGVTVTHSNVIHSTASRFSFYKKQPERFLLLSSFTFDSSIAGIFWTLSTGNTLVIPERRTEQDVLKLGRIIKQHKITHTLLLPSLYNVILEHIEKENLNSLNTIIVAGEECTVKVSQSHYKTLPQVDLFNEYGPTEGTVWAIAHNIKETDNSPIPIGKPIPYVQLYVLDDNLNLVPKGVKGELYIGGPTVALGYLNNFALSKKQFIQNPFSNISGELIYKTGDIVKINHQDNFEFHGRKDDQVKLRGFRIELDEISRVIQQNPSIKEVVTILEEHISTDDNLSEIDKLNNKLNQLEEQQALLLLDSISYISESEQVMLYKELKN